MAVSPVLVVKLVKDSALSVRARLYDDFAEHEIVTELKFLITLCDLCFTHIFLPSFNCWQENRESITL